MYMYMYMHMHIHMYMHMYMSRLGEERRPEERVHEAEAVPGVEPHAPYNMCYYVCYVYSIV